MDEKPLREQFPLVPIVTGEQFARAVAFYKQIENRTDPEAAVYLKALVELMDEFEESSYLMSSCC